MHDVIQAMVLSVAAVLSGSALLMIRPWSMPLATESGWPEATAIGVLATGLVACFSLGFKIIGMYNNQLREMHLENQEAIREMTRAHCTQLEAVCGELRKISTILTTEVEGRCHDSSK